MIFQMLIQAPNLTITLLIDHTLKNKYARVKLILHCCTQTSLVSLSAPNVGTALFDGGGR